MREYESTVEYRIEVLGLDESIQVEATHEKQALYRGFKRYKESGNGNSYILFKKRVISCHLV